MAEDYDILPDNFPGFLRREEVEGVPFFRYWFDTMENRQTFINIISKRTLVLEKLDAVE